MTIEDVAERADVWSEAIKKIVKSIAAAGVALATGIAALLAWWPSGDTSEETPSLLQELGMVLSVLSFTIQSTITGLNNNGQSGKSYGKI